MSGSGTWGRIALPLTVYGLTHAAVDAACAALLMGAVAAGRLAVGDALAIFLVYNVVAFALQPLAGLLVDRGGSPRGAAVAGAFLTAAAVPLSLAPGLVAGSVVLAGIGNAVFHVGGGVASLQMTSGRASAPGLYVAPGAAGLATGALLSKSGGPLWVAAAALVVLGVALALLPRDAGAQTASAPLARRAAVGFGVEGAVLLVLAVVALRSYTGLAIALPWKSALPLLGALTVAVVLGKALGGVLADRFGFARIGVGALAISAPLLMMAPHSAAAGILGMLAFNMTMPVTLVAVANTLPDNPGFAFGLASLALSVGAFPVLAEMTGKLSAPGAIGVVVGVSALALAVALRWLEHPPAHRTPVTAKLEEAVE